MQGISVDVGNELQDVAAEVELLAGALELVRQSAADRDRVRLWLDIQGLASGVEKIYTGRERVMAMIAQRVDGAKIDRDVGWHIALLKRMAHPYPDVRGPVIGQETYRALDWLRAFRHRERNTYGAQLDEALVEERAEETADAYARFKADVAGFLATFGDLAPK